MIRSGIACVALVACASPASAELAVHELEQQPFQAEIASLFTLEQGDLLLRMRGHRDVVYVLAPDGEVRERAVARVTAAGDPIRLEEYSVSYGGITGGGTTLMFAAPYDGAKVFWKIITSKVAPHLDRMQELEQRFMQMTGCVYGRDDSSRASIDDVLAGLENAARVVNQRIANIAPEELAAIGPLCGASQLRLRRDGFGTGDGAMLPLAVADRTFLDVVRRNREAEARGDVFHY